MHALVGQRPLRLSKPLLPPTFCHRFPQSFRRCHRSRRSLRAQTLAPQTLPPRHHHRNDNGQAKRKTRRGHQPSQSPRPNGRFQRPLAGSKGNLSSSTWGLRRHLHRRRANRRARTIPSATGHRRRSHSHTVSAGLQTTRVQRTNVRMATPAATPPLPRRRLRRQARLCTRRPVRRPQIRRRTRCLYGELTSNGLGRCCFCKASRRSKCGRGRRTRKGSRCPWQATRTRTSGSSKHQGT